MHTLVGAACQYQLIMVRKSEFSDSATDYTLMTTCSQMIKQYCRRDHNEYAENALDCLRVHKDEPLFDHQCRLVVVNRMISQHYDIRYNPKLQEACSENIATYCTHIVAKAGAEQELSGKVVECLRVRFREGKLTEKCQVQMTEVLREQALNYRLNPLLTSICRNEIALICEGDINEQGKVEECLKVAFLEHRLMSTNCRYEVATMLEEARADIHVDPLLQQACQVDLLKYCSTVQSGNGRHLQCLQTILADVSQALEPDCKEKLERRMEMFHNAAAVVAHKSPEDLKQLYEQVANSPSRNYFAVFVLAALLMFFAMGALFGRVTRRHAVLKNK